MFWFMIVFNCFIWISFSESISEITSCQDHSRKFLDENIPKIVDVILGSTVHLECNFCNEQDDFLPKLWYFRKRGSDSNFIEKELDMETNVTKIKMSMTPSHRLDIHNFQLNDSGIYCCKSNDPEITEDIFLYFLDGVYHDIKINSGKLSQWMDYKRQKLDVINENFETSTTEPFASLRDNLNLTFKVLNVWGPWGTCKAIGKHKGIRRKRGYCRLQPLPHTCIRRIFCFACAVRPCFLPNLMIPDQRKITPTSNVAYEKTARYFLKDNFEISCHSLSLNEVLPEISRIVRNLPDYEIIESCDTAIYIPAVSSMGRANKNAFKYKCTKHIGENSHLTLTCPEVALESNVDWYKGNEILNSSFRNNMADSEQEPRITIDAYNCLYILHATKNEEALYSCTVDGEKMQRFDVRVVSKSNLLNQDFIRYSIYLGFVLTLSLSCYCSGMCVAWHRRSSFADPLNIKSQLKKKHKRPETQRLLP